MSRAHASRLKSSRFIFYTPQHGDNTSERLVTGRADSPARYAARFPRVVLGYYQSSYPELLDAECARCRPGAAHVRCSRLWEAWPIPATETPRRVDAHGGAQEKDSLSVGRS